MPREIAGRGIDPAPEGPYLARDTRLVELPRKAHHDVEALPDDIHEAIGEGEVEAHLRAALRELAEQGRDLQDAERDGR